MQRAITLAALSSGMSDILSPFLVVFPKSDALAYMCFSALMNNIRQNFLEGQPGIHTSIQHIGSLLQRVDKKLWRQIGTDSFDRQTLQSSVSIAQHAWFSWIRSTRSGQSTGQLGRVWQFDKASVQAQQSMSIVVVKQCVVAVLHGFACNATVAGGSFLCLGSNCPQTIPCLACRLLPWSVTSRLLLQ